MDLLGFVVDIETIGVNYTALSSNLLQRMKGLSSCPCNFLCIPSFFSSISLYPPLDIWFLPQLTEVQQLSLSQYLIFVWGANVTNTFL